MSTVYGVYHIGFLLDNKVSLDGARGDAKFFTDTHRIGSGELRGESGEHLFGLRGSGGGLTFYWRVRFWGLIDIYVDFTSPTPVGR